MAWLESKAWDVNQHAVYFVTAGSTDLPTTCDFLNVGDWVVNVNPSMAVGDPAVWVVTSISGVTPTFTAFANVGSNPVSTVTANTTVATSAKTLLANAVSAGFKITLPAIATANKGFAPRIIKSDTSTNPVTVTPSGANTINGQTGDYVMNTPYQAMEIASDGSSNWDRVLGSVPSNQRSAGSATTVTPADSYILVSAGATITLQAATAYPVGQEVTIRNISTANVTVTPAQGNIDGYASLTLNPYASVGVVTDASNWWTVTQFVNHGIRLATLTTTMSPSSTITTADQIVIFTSAGMANIPSASTWPSGYVLTLKAVGAATVSTPGGNIYTAAAQTTVTTLAAYAALQLTVDPAQTNWYSVG